MSYAVLPTSVIPLFPGTYVMKNKVFKYSEVINPDQYLYFKNTFTPTIVNASGNLPSTLSVWI
jgi:hypothetical protein